MDFEEIVAQLKDLCAGKSVEEIEQMIEESTIAEKVANAHQLARYFVSIAADDEEASPGPDDEVPADVESD